ncbi:hypothetical protein LCGC14_1514780, partial [marine sediment metagenome]
SKSTLIDIIILLMNERESSLAREKVTLSNIRDFRKVASGPALEGFKV